MNLTPAASCVASVYGHRRPFVHGFYSVLPRRATPYGASPSEGAIPERHYARDVNVMLLFGSSPAEGATTSHFIRFGASNSEGVLPDMG